MRGSDECSLDNCETCVHFATDTTFQPVLLRQRDHAARNHQDTRVELFDGLLARLDPEIT
jgi:hypothetical protein